MVSRGERRAKGAPAFACAHLGVDPPFAEEVRGQGSKLLAKTTKGGQDKGLGLREGNLFSLGRNRRVQVRVLEGVQPEQAGLEAKVCLRQRVVTLHRLHHGFDGLWRDFVCQMGGQDHVVIVPQRTVHLVVEEQVVEDSGQHQRVAGMGFKKGGKGALAQAAVGVAEQCHDFAIGQFAFFTVDGQLEMQGAGELLVQLLEGAAAGEMFLVEDLFFFLTERVGLKASQRFDIMLVLGHLRRGQQRSELLLLQGDHLECEKDQQVSDLGRGFTGVLDQVLGFAVLGVGSKQQGGIK